MLQNTPEYLVSKSSQANILEGLVLDLQVIQADFSNLVNSLSEIGSSLQELEVWVSEHSQHQMGLN